MASLMEAIAENHTKLMNAKLHSKEMYDLAEEGRKLNEKLSEAYAEILERYNQGFIAASELVALLALEMKRAEI